jgi:hypothetical protein
MTKAATQANQPTAKPGCRHGVARSRKGTVAMDPEAGAGIATVATAMAIAASET